MSPYITPVTNRTAADVASKTAKAFINVADWQRIHNNALVVEALVEFLGKISIPSESIPTVTQTTIPRGATLLNNLLSNINQIRANANLPVIAGLDALKDDWAVGVGADAPDYLDANEWETVLDLIRSMAVNAVTYRVYCGVSNSGQPRLWQHRFRETQSWVPDAESPVRLARAGVTTCGAGLTRNNEYRRYT